MGLLKRLQTLLGNIRPGRKRNRPPTDEEWNQLPDFVKTLIVYAVFDASQGMESELFIAHWVRRGPHG